MPMSLPLGFHPMQMLVPALSIPLYRAFLVIQTLDVVNKVKLVNVYPRAFACLITRRERGCRLSADPSQQAILTCVYI